MKAKQIRFFSPDENSEETKKVKKSTVKAEPIKGYVSAAGKLVFPDKAIAQIGLDPENKRFKIGTQEGKRKIKSLFLIPGTEGEEETFELSKGAKSHSISLAYILQKGGIDYAKEKHEFIVKPFDYEAGITGFELKLSTDAPKPEYTGKPRGRRRQASVSE
ncbi:hypothetical protein [Spirosoma sp.]|uniref:hypothetical protein n=1 Tax=Spirosoma sp. TaxID=1899569 RepID=UPI003B3AC278